MNWAMIFSMVPLHLSAAYDILCRDIRAMREADELAIADLIARGLIVPTENGQQWKECQTETPLH